MGSKQTGTATSTSSSSPWAPQQPYLQDIFQQAQNLYQNNTPQYYPGATYAAPNAYQQNAIDATANFGANDYLTNNALNQDSRMMSGQFLNSNPAMFGLGVNGGTNIGAANLGTGALMSQAADGIFNPAAGGLSYLGSINSGSPATNEGATTLSGLSSFNPGVNLGSQTLGQLSGYNPGANAPGTPAFDLYASGAKTAAGNPYDTALSQNVLSQVVPSIESQFISSGTLSSPEAARATAAGATAALAPSLFQNYQNEEANQLGAAGALNNAYLSGYGAQTGAANALSNSLLSGYGAQAGAASNLANSILSGNQQQIGALSNLGQQALTGTGLQQSAASTLGQQALQGEAQQNQALGTLSNAYTTGTQQMLSALGLAPMLQQMPYTDLSQLYSAGAAQQQLQQQGINDAVARYNYGQQLPYSQLNQYIGQVTGNYGGTTIGSQPIVSNPFQSTMSGLGSAVSGLGSAAKIGSMFLK